LSHFPNKNGQQNVNVEKEPTKKDNDDEESEELQNMQVGNLLECGDSTSDDGSYIVDFRVMQFSQ